MYNFENETTFFSPSNFVRVQSREISSAARSIGKMAIGRRLVSRSNSAQPCKLTRLQGVTHIAEGVEVTRLREHRADGLDRYVCLLGCHASSSRRFSSHASVERDLISGKRCE